MDGAFLITRSGSLVGSTIKICCPKCKYVLTGFNVSLTINSRNKNAPQVLVQTKQWPREPKTISLPFCPGRRGTRLPFAWSIHSQWVPQRTANLSKSRLLVNKIIAWLVLLWGSIKGFPGMEFECNMVDDYMLSDAMLEVMQRVDYHSPIPRMRHRSFQMLLQILGMSIHEEQDEKLTWRGDGVNLDFIIRVGIWMINLCSVFLGWLIHS